MTRNTILLALAAAGVVLTTIAPASALSIRPPRHQISPTTYACGAELGYLRRIQVEQLESVFDETQVSVVAVCDGEDAALRNEGNAGAIRQHIAGNDAMTAALGRRAYTAEDVVGIRMIADDKVVLYVHESNY